MISRRELTPTIPKSEPTQGKSWSAWDLPTEQEARQSWSSITPAGSASHSWSGLTPAEQSAFKQAEKRVLAPDEQSVPKPSALSSGQESQPSVFIKVAGKNWT